MTTTIKSKRKPTAADVVITRGVVLIVKQPTPWMPKTPNDFPSVIIPDEIVDMPSGASAATFAHHFNRLEMRDQTDRWAITLPGRHETK